MPTESKSAGFGIPRDHGNDLKGAVSEIHIPLEGSFFSTLFLVPKKDGGEKLVKIDLKDAYFSIPIRKQGLPVQLSPIRPGLSPMGLYQDSEADSSSRTGVGDTVGGRHRRYSPNGGDQAKGQRPRVRPDAPSPMPRVHNRPGENKPTTT